MGGYQRRLCLNPTLSKDTELRRNFRHAARSHDKVEISGFTRSAEILERTTFFTVYFCLGYRSEVKGARIFHFLELDMVDALRIVIDLKKVKADGLKVIQDNRAPIVGPSSITPWMMFSRVRWLKHQFF